MLNLESLSICAELGKIVGEFAIHVLLFKNMNEVVNSSTIVDESNHLCFYKGTASTGFKHPTFVMSCDSNL